MLTIKNLNVYYGAIHAVKDLNMEVGDGEIVTLLGSNGAGKSTTLHTISGLINPKTGSILYKGKDVVGIPAHKLVGQGLVQVPEGRHVFAEMTVMENLDMGAYLRTDKDGIARDKEKVFEKFPRLKERISQTAGTLRSRPQRLLLDEPSMGLAPLLVREIFSIIKEINSEGTTVLLVEQNANMALSIADRAYVLETGRVVLSGTAAELAASEAVQKAYLGG